MSMVDTEIQSSMVFEEEQDDSKRQAEEMAARLNALGASLAKKRKDAVEFRDQSGIEQQWEMDDDAYNGVDDVNRATESWQKPASMEGRVTLASRGQAQGVKSTVFVNITQPYCDMAAARVCGMLLPTDDRPFGLLPTPLPEIAEFEESPETATFPDGTQAPAGQVVEMIRTKAKEIAKKSEDRIWDWLVESQWHTEVRRVIEDAARIGTGVLKGPFPRLKPIKKVVRDEVGVTQVEIDSQPAPFSKRVSVLNIFPDPACGENIHYGSYLWERDYFSRKQVEMLKGSDYLDDQIDKILDEGPGKNEDGEQDEYKKRVFDIWYYYGQITKDDMLAAGGEVVEEMPPQVHAIVTMINDRVIKATISPLDSGEFPFDVLPWQRVDGSWTGIGVARQIRSPQKMLNSATRVMLDNGGLSKEPIKFFRRGSVDPADGSRDYSLTPGKTFFVDDAEMRSINDIVSLVTISNNQEQYAAIIQYALDMAERLTSMPLIMQGQQGAATDTVGGMTLLQNNANSVLRRIAKLFDDYITEPHIRRYYEYLLLYGENEEEKGDNVIDARGSSALYERDAQDQSVMQVLQFAANPAFGVDPRLAMIEALKSLKLDPARFGLKDDGKELPPPQQAPDPSSGQIAVAKVRVEGEMKKAQLVQESDMTELNFKASEAEKQRQHEARMKDIELKIEQMKMDRQFAYTRALELDKSKVKMADTTMKLNTQKELSAQAFAQRDKEVTEPPTEPALRADDGRSFEQ